LPAQAIFLGGLGRPERAILLEFHLGCPVTMPRSRRRGLIVFGPSGTSLPPNNSADLLVDIITAAAEAHRQAGDRDIRFERRRVDETAHKRWCRATDAQEFFKSDTFLQFMELFGMKADSVFGRIRAL
jgi:hypothetical protein